MFRRVYTRATKAKPGLRTHGLIGGKGKKPAPTPLPHATPAPSPAPAPASTPAAPFVRLTNQLWEYPASFDEGTRAAFDPKSAPMYVFHAVSAT